MNPIKTKKDKESLENVINSFVKKGYCITEIVYDKIPEESDVGDLSFVPRKKANIYFK